MSNPYITVMDDAIANVEKDLDYKRMQLMDRLKIFRCHAAEASSDGIRTVQQDVDAVQAAAAGVKEDEVLLSNLRSIRERMLAADPNSEENRFKEKVSEFAKEFDNLMWDYDSYGYNDSFHSREEGVAAWKKAAVNLRNRSLLVKLVSIGKTVEDDRLAQRAAELVKKLHVIRDEVLLKEGRDA